MCSIETSFVHHIDFVTHLLHSNFAEAMQLANIVADSRYGLYDDFLRNNHERLFEYLQSVHQCILNGLVNGGGDPFWFTVPSAHVS